MKNEWYIRRGNLEARSCNERLLQTQPHTTGETCNKPLSKHEVDDSNTYIGGECYYCTKHLNEKMDW